MSRNTRRLASICLATCAVASIAVLAVTGALAKGTGGPKSYEYPFSTTLFNPCALKGAGEAVDLSGTITFTSQSFTFRATGLGEVTHVKYSVKELARSVYVVPRKPNTTEYQYYRSVYRDTVRLIGQGKASDFTAQLVFISAHTKGRGFFESDTISTSCN